MTQKVNEQYHACREQVFACSNWLSEHGYFGLLTGTGGNVSVRIPGEERIVITPSSVAYKSLFPADMCVVNFDQTVVEGGLKPSVECGMHIAIYKNRPDVDAVVHTHQTFASVFAVLSLPVPALFDEVAFAIGDIIDVVPYALSGSPELAANVSSMLSNGCHCYIMQNHGALSLGKTTEQALLHAEMMEKACRIYCHALSTGKAVKSLPDEIVDLIRELRKGSA
jgi:ribulose-5-phosphate 4-epimerase/fuculose-1-phosphate aldolase